MIPDPSFYIEKMNHPENFEKDENILEFRDWSYLEDSEDFEDIEETQL